MKKKAKPAGKSAIGFRFPEALLEAIDGEVSKRSAETDPPNRQAVVIERLAKSYELENVSRPKEGRRWPGKKEGEE